MALVECYGVPIYFGGLKRAACAMRCTADASARRLLGGNSQDLRGIFKANPDREVGAKSRIEGRQPLSERIFSSA